MKQSPATAPSSVLVSVVMATYNGEAFVDAQLSSILDQTHSNLEIIVVDDGSTDQTFAKLEAYAAQDDRIRLIRNKQNLGYVRNFEQGLLLATGQFVAPSDQDDIWMPEKISTLLNQIGDATIVYCDSELIEENGSSMAKNLSQIKRLTDFNDCIGFLVGNSAAGHAMLIRTALIHNAVPFAPMIPHDHWLGFVATLYHGIKFVNEPLVQYRQHNQSVFGAVKVNDAQDEPRPRRKKNKKDLAAIRERVRLMYNRCPDSLPEEKEMLRKCDRYYSSFSLTNNFNRMCFFFIHNKRILVYKRRSLLRRWLYSIKLFFTIQ